MENPIVAETGRRDGGPGSKSKKKGKKKKGAASKGEENGSGGIVNGNGNIAILASEMLGPDAEDDVEDVEELSKSPTKSQPDAEEDEDPDPDSIIDMGHALTNGNGAKASPSPSPSISISSAVAAGIARSRQQQASPLPPAMANTTSPPSSSDTSKVLDALLTERDTLRAEVTELRKSLEDIQGKHEEELANVQEQVEEAQAGKDHFEAQYQNLLGRVNGIRTSLGDRLKADAAKLEEALAQVEVLEERNRSIEEANSTLLSEISKLRQHSESQAAEIASLRSRASISQQNWIKERDELIQREAFAREEFQNAKQAMQDWEVLAMDERSLRESLGDRISELEEQLGAQKEAYERAASERDIQSTTVDGLQRALQEVQNARKTERRELVEQSQAQLEELRKQLQIAEEASSASKAALEMTQKELERALPFEKEVKEKNLLIGKLRHEAVTLNDHLTKALRILRKGKPEDNVDRQIVTNYLLHFLAIDRTDPKKFEALQLIAALLNWTDEQREQAGLARPGTSNSSLRIPLSPFRRTPSTPALSADSLLAANSRNSKESLAELWSSFLEQEAVQDGGERRGSGASTGGPGAGGEGKGKEREGVGLGLGLGGGQK